MPGKDKVFDCICDCRLIATDTLLQKVEREKKKKKEQRELVLKKRLLANKDHFVPDHLQGAQEKAFRKLATRGGIKPLPAPLHFLTISFLLPM